MKIAIVHYHLRRGGVTRVIQTTLDALVHDGVHIAVLSGEPAPQSESLSCPVGVVDGLGYDNPGTNVSHPNLPALSGRRRASTSAATPMSGTSTITPSEKTPHSPAHSTSSRPTGTASFSTCTIFPKTDVRRTIGT